MKQSHQNSGASYFHKLMRIYLRSQVQQVFPHYPSPILIENLRQTRSVSVTSNNILEGLLPLYNMALGDDAEVSQNSGTAAENTQASGSTFDHGSINDSE